jgi:hypothetical protein
MPKKRRAKRKPEPEPVAVTGSDDQPKTLMQTIFEAQRAELNRLNDEIQKVIFLGW